jgi:RNA polymerase sigma-32 factor
MGSAYSDSNGSDRHFVSKAMSVPMLTAEHEHELALKWRDERDERALQELTGAYMRLVVSMARRFRAYGLPTSDLVQEGAVGLMQAAARFEPDREVRFSTYASWWIRASMQDYILRNWSIVRTGTTAAQKSLFFNLRRLRARFGDLEGHLGTEACQSIAVELELKESDVQAMAGRMSGADRSLNAPVGEDGAEWQTFLVDEADLPDAQAMQSHDDMVRETVLETAMKNLNGREIAILKARRLCEDPITLEALGRNLGVSKERVRQIEQVALAKLKTSIQRQVGDPFEAGLLS